MTNTSLYDIIRAANILSPKRLDQAFSIANDMGSSIFKVLLSQNFIKEKVLLETIAPYLDIPYELIDQSTVDYRVSGLIPESFARDRSVLPLFQLGNVLSVAICDPFDLQTLEEIEMITTLDINPILTLKSNIDSLFAYCYAYQSGDQSDASSMSSLFEMGMKLVETRSASDDEIYDLAQEAPIAKLVETIIKQAIFEKASDIHIEPEENVVKIRFRVDGLLKDVMTPPKKLEAPIVSRIKVLANLDITETRKPQDGRITFTLKDRSVDFRVSTIRTISGEKVVLRLLDKSGSFVSLEKLGLSESAYLKIISLISSTSGIIIVCGPTGSGKTSSLYSCLNKINTPEKNIITIEDPVEYHLNGINQIPVNPKIGVDFITGLTSIVRQDPDVIMVGEVRDIETANISIQAALTGHLVFTTLHTRNAPGAITRLLDMGIAPFLLNSAIVGVIGQRLVRTICPNCKIIVASTQYVDFKHIAVIDQLKKIHPDDPILYRGQGCKFCDSSGYKGRTGIFELLPIQESVRDLIAQKASSAKILQAATQIGMTTMLEDGFQKILSGLTTVEEVARVLDL